MLKGLSFLALPLFLLATPAQADSTLYLNTGSQQTTFTSSQGTFAAPKLTGGAHISYNQTAPSQRWDLYFAAPSGATLAPGNYDYAQRWPFQSPVGPGLSISGNGAGCNTVSGRFVIREITFDGSGNVTVFAADFEQDCDNNATPLLGAIRYNSSVPVQYPNPTADAGIKQLVLEGAGVTLDGSLSTPGNGASITSYLWEQESGPAVSLSDVTAAKPVFTAPAVDPGGVDLVFQLTVDDSNGHSAVSGVIVHVADSADPVTALTWISDSGDYIGQGNSLSLTPSQALFTPTALTANSTQGTGVQITVNDGVNDNWTLDFAAAAGQTLTAGTSYDLAQRYPFQSTGHPGLSVYGSGRGCNMVSGRFVVLDLQTDGSGNITSFAADFEQHCEGQQPALHGKIRYQSVIPVTAPWADAGSAQVVMQGLDVTLDAGDSDAGGQGESIVSYQWVQLSGPSVTLSDPTAADPGFTAPTVSSGGADLVFQVTITNSDGLTSSATVTVHVASASDPVTLLHVASPAGDSAGEGLTVDLNSLSSNFTVNSVGTGSNGGVQGVGFTVNSATAAWIIDLVAPSGQNLQPGNYGSATAYPWQSTGSPGISIYLGGHLCTNALGSFTVLDIQTSAGKITSFAADFWQRCGSTAPLLRGKIRYNSTVSIYDPQADAGQSQWVREGDTAVLSADASDAGGSAVHITAYQWTQFSGPSVTLSDAGAADPSFTAPDVPLGGADLTFQLTIINSLGLSSSASVTIHVADSSDPAPATYLTTVSDPGDPVGNGNTATVDSSQQTFTVTRLAGNGLEIVVGSRIWDIDLVPPAGQQLQAGKTYDLAQRYPFQGPISPGLSVGGCNTLSGRFAVLEIAYDDAGNVTRLAVDFEQHCNRGVPALHGILRYNSGIASDAPFADAGPAQLVLEGATTNLDGSASFAGGGDTVTAFQWTQLSGPIVTLSDATAPAPSFTAPYVAPGGVDLVFQLSVTSSNGRSGSDTIRVHVADSADPITALYMKSDAGDYIGGGQVTDIGPLDAAFSVGSSTSSGVHVSVNGGSINSWTLDFVPSINQTLQVGGDYDGAQRYPFQSPALPGLDVSGNGSGCNTLTGRFAVLDIQTDSNGKVTSYAADFVQHCEGGTAALHGKIRYNSTVSLDTPFAVAGSDQSAQQGGTVTLSGAGSDAGSDQDSIATYQWVQLSGPEVTLSDPNSVTTTFTSPDVPPGGADLTFQLTITTVDGKTSTDTITVHVANPTDPKTVLYMGGDTGDYIDGGRTSYLTPLNASFSAQGLVSTGAHVSVNGGTYDDWTLDFVAPSGQTLTAGTTYTLAQRWPFQASNAPGLSVDGSGRGCNTLSGSFTVREIQYGSGSTITKLAVDFVQHCEGVTPALYGAIRFNSAVPIDYEYPNAGADQSTFEDMPVTLDGTGSHVGIDGTFTYSWSQVIVPGDPTVELSPLSTGKAIFSAPAVPSGGRTLTFRLTISNSDGTSATDIMHVKVGNEQDPKTAFYYESDPGDAAGRGTNGLITSDFNSFNQPLNIGFLLAQIHGNQPISDEGWNFSFTEGVTPPGLGTFFSGVGASAPGFSAALDDVECDAPSGAFIVRDIGFDGGDGTSNGILSRLAVDFVQHCAGSDAVLRGAYRYNSAVPMLIDMPTAVAGPNQDVTGSNTVVTLDGSLSFSAWGPITGYSWTQVSGPPVTLSGSDTPVAHFSLTPKLLHQGAAPLVFALKVTNSLGLSDTAHTVVRTTASVTNTLSLQSDLGDSIGRGQSKTYALDDGSVNIGVQKDNSVRADFRGAASGWSLMVAAPNGQALAAGTYTGAVNLTKFTRGSPGLAVAFKNLTCRKVSGDFNVLDVQYGAHGSIQSLALDFDQFCNGSSAGLHGKLRYHSVVP